MFGIGFPELVLILIIGLIVFGPGKLPEMGRALGKGIREFRKASNAFSQAINAPDQPVLQQTAAPQNVQQPAAQKVQQTAQPVSPAPSAPVQKGEAQAAASPAPADGKSAAGGQAAAQAQPPVYQAPTQESVRRQLDAQQQQDEQKKN